MSFVVPVLKARECLFLDEPESEHPQSPKAKLRAITPHQIFLNLVSNMVFSPNQGGPSRDRTQEIQKQFGNPFVRSVFNALHNKELTLHKTSQILGLKKASQVLKLEKNLCDIVYPQRIRNHLIL